MDKLVGQRMKGRGRSWRLSGAQAMLAILRNKVVLQNHAFHYTPILSSIKRINRVVPAHNQDDFLPKSGSLPLFRSNILSEQWVQLLKRKLDDNLSLTAFY